MVVAALFDCTESPDLPWCGQTIAEAAMASLILCSDQTAVVPDDELETEVETTPATLPLLVIAVADTQTVAAAVIVQLTAVASGGVGPHSVTWEIVEGPAQPAVPSGVTAEVTLDLSGTYWFVATATDANGESVDDTILVEITVPAELVVSAGSDQLAVVGESVVLGGSAQGGDGDYTYEWSPATGLSDPNVAEPTLTLDQPGTFGYTLTVTDGAGSQVSADATVVVVEALLAAAAGSDKTVTIGQTITLTGDATGGDGDYSYHWSPTTGLSDPNVARPTLNTSSFGTGAFELTLTVTDGTDSRLGLCNGDHHLCSCSVSPCDNGHQLR
jgi:hypothetical protein